MNILISNSFDHVKEVSRLLTLDKVYHAAYVLKDVVRHTELSDVDVIVAAVGGGGLCSGIAFAVKSLNPNIQVYGVQAEGAASMVKSM